MSSIKKHGSEARYVDRNNHKQYRGQARGL